MMLFIIKNIIFLSVCVSLSLCAPSDNVTETVVSTNKERHYDGYKVLRVKLDNDEQLRKLQQLSEHETEMKINFWSEPRITNSSVDLMISPETAKKIEDILAEGHIQARTLIPDVGTIMEQQKTSEPVDDHGLLYMQDGKTNITAFFSKYQPMNNVSLFLIYTKSISS